MVTNNTKNQDTDTYKSESFMDPNQVTQNTNDSRKEVFPKQRTIKTEKQSEKQSEIYTEKYSEIKSGSLKKETTYSEIRSSDHFVLGTKNTIGSIATIPEEAIESQFDHKSSNKVSRDVK